MARIKDKHIRLPGSAAPLLEELREKMKRTTTVGGMIVNPAVKLTDGLVLSWALAISNYLMNPKFSLIDREEFTEKFFKVLAPHLATMADCTEDEQQARISLCVVAASQVGGYNTSEALTSEPPEGETPS